MAPRVVRPRRTLNLARRYKSCLARYFSSSPRKLSRARLLRHGFGALRQRPLGRVAPKRHARDVGGTLRVCPPRACRFAPRGRASSRSSLSDRARDVRAPLFGRHPRFQIASARVPHASPPGARARPEPLREYLRLVELSDGSWELQSATAAFRRPDGEPLEVSLAATVHVGDASYYQGLQDECESSYDCVLFELITAEENLKPGPWPTPTDPPGDHPSFAASASSSSPSNVGDAPFLPQLAADLTPTEEARNLAGVHGLLAQLDAVDFRRPAWYVADVPKAELVRMQEEAGERPLADAPAASSSVPACAPRRRRRPGSLPPALEALLVTARGRAGGGPARQMIRAMCWLVPCPEAHLLLLDWVWGGGRPAPVLGAMLDSLAGGKLEAVRRLAFAQMIVSAQAKGAVGGGADVPVLVSKRNDVAVECLRVAMTAPGVRKIGLLYGGLHMPGLAKKMAELGLEPSTQRWRAVWRVEAPSRSPLTRWLALPTLLALDGPTGPPPSPMPPSTSTEEASAPRSPRARSTSFDTAPCTTASGSGCWSGTNNCSTTERCRSGTGPRVFGGDTGRKREGRVGDGGEDTRRSAARAGKTRERGIAAT